MSDDIETTRDDDVLIFTYGLLGEMKEAGLVEGGTHRLSEKGRERFEQLRESGFSPTDVEVVAAMRAIQAGEAAAIAEMEA